MRKAKRCCIGIGPDPKPITSHYFADPCAVSGNPEIDRVKKARTAATCGVNMRKRAMEIDRRGMMASVAALTLTGCVGPRQVAPSIMPNAALAALEARVGGRLGAAVIDTASGRMTGHHYDEAFAMCSTFKLALAAAVLTGRPRQAESRYGPALYAGGYGPACPSYGAKSLQGRHAYHRLGRSRAKDQR